MPTCRPEAERAVHEAVNVVRERHDLPSLEFDAGLQIVARYHSVDMLLRDFFGHESPDGDTFLDRYRLHGFSCGSLREGIDHPSGGRGGENIAQLIRVGGGPAPPPFERMAAAELARKVVSRWMASEGHRQNLLDGRWRYHGIGLASDRSGTRHRVVATQNFC